MWRTPRVLLAFVAAASIAAPLSAIAGATPAAADVGPPDATMCVGGGPGALASYREALAKADTAPVDVLAVGDSITEGFGASSDSTRWIDGLRRRLQSAYGSPAISGGAGYRPAWHVLGGANGWTWGSTSGTWAPAWTSTGYGLGDRAAVLDAAGRYGELTFSGDRFWLLYTQRPSGTPVDVSIDGGPATRLATVGTTTLSGRQWDSGALSNGVHTVRVTAAPVPGVGTVSAVVDGVMVFDGDGGATPGTGRGVRMWDAGRSAATVPLYLLNPALGFDADDTVDPDLILIGFGANDLRANVTAEQHKANVAAMIDRYRTGTAPAPHASIAIWIEPGWGDIAPSTWQPYVDALHELGTEKGVAVIDPHRRLSQGGDPTYFVDSIHLNDAGNDVFADALAQALIDGTPCTTTSGTVTTATGAPAPGACVTAYRLGASDPTASVTTAPDGSFTLPDLDPNVDYDIFTSDCGGTGIVASWFGGALDRASGTSVLAGTVDLAITVATSGSTDISGSVVTDGVPIAGVCIDAFAHGAATPAGSSRSVADGSWTVSALDPSRTYDLRFTDCGSNAFVPEWWKDASDQSAATPVAPGTRGLAVGLMPVPAPTSIAGTVTGDSGAALAGVCVYVFPAGQATATTMVKTAADGSFSAPGLVAGAPYQVGLYDCSGAGYVAEWWKDAPTQADATSITPGTVIDPVMSPAPTSITGTVTTDAGTVLPGICVDVYTNGATAPSTSVTTGADGTFVIGGLSPYPTYQLRFSDCTADAFVAEWWHDASSQSAATVLSTGAVVTASLAAKPAATRLTGKVTSDSGAALAGICVGVYRSGSATATTSVVTATDGTFTATGLTGGLTYQVQFTDCSGKGYASEWWQDAATQAAATGVAPGANVVATLSPAPTSITGTVTSDAGGALGGICVDAFASGSTKSVAKATTAANGTFTLSRLSSTSTYQLRLTDCNKRKRYTTEWWKDAATQAAALKVTPGTAVTPSLGS